MAKLTADQLFLEIEDVIRTMPPSQSLGNDDAEVMSWLGRAAAVMRAWDLFKGTEFGIAVERLSSWKAGDFNAAVRSVQVLLNQARFDLRMTTVGPLSVNMTKGAVFDYFDELRKIVEGAKSDILFVDPYLDSEFVSRYLVHVTPGARVRVLGRERISTLVPAASLLRQQSALAIEVRSAPGFHDRYVLVDGNACFQSGASFKDGARNAPTTLTQIVDAFAAVKDTYEQLWSSATVHP